MLTFLVPQEMVRASMKLSAVESSISEREAGWREGGVPAEQLGQGTQLQTLQGERESLLKEVRELQNRMKSESFLSLEEERRWVGRWVVDRARVTAASDLHRVHVQCHMFCSPQRTYVVFCVCTYVRMYVCPCVYPNACTVYLPISTE